MRIVISAPVLPAWSYAVLAALVFALFDWVAWLIELPLRPVGAAVTGWLMAFLLLCEILALLNVPGWFVGRAPGICPLVADDEDGKGAEIRRADSEA